MTTNLVVIANVKQLRTGGSFRILLPFFGTSWGVGFLNSAIFFTFFTIGLILARFWRAFGISGWGGGGLFETPNPLLGTPLLTIYAHTSQSILAHGSLQKDYITYCGTLARLLQAKHNVKYRHMFISYEHYM